MKECYHCKELIDENEPHDCWTTTESNLTKDLSEDLVDAWERLRETAADFGEHAFMRRTDASCSRQACYFFVRPKKKVLEVCIFLGRTVKTALVRK